MWINFTLKGDLKVTLKSPLSPLLRVPSHEGVGPGPRALLVTEELKEAVNRDEPVARNPYVRNLNGGRSRSKESTMDPLKKPVTSGLGRPVKRKV